MTLLSVFSEKLCIKNILFILAALLIASGIMVDEAEAKRRGYSRSRSRSSSYRRSRSRPRSQTSRTKTRSRRRSKGGALGGMLSSKSNRPKASSSHRPNRARSSGDYKRKPARRSRSRGRRHQRYSNRGNWWSKPSSYKSRWRKSFKPRRRFRRSFYSRSRPIVDIWDPYFLASAATTLFWYHHWNDTEIQEALYVDHVLEDADLKTLESEVQSFESQGLVRDPDYLPEGIGPQDAYSDSYLDRERRRREEGGGGLVLLISILVGLGLGFKFFRG